MKMKENFYIVLMAGGAGTRLWPVSRQNLPKQFHKLASEKSLLRETYERVKDLDPKENIFVSLSQNTLQETQRQLKEVPKNNFIVEPESRNTAPAIALITAKLFRLNPEAVCATISSDHTVKKIANYQKAILRAARFAEENPEYLVTIGIKPTEPHTGYGYIKKGRKFQQKSVLAVERFVEKPDLQMAQEYLKSGDYLWNAGYFIFKAKNMLEMFKTYAPEIYQAIRTFLPVLGGSDEKEILSKVYAKLPKVPIDTALAEKAEKIAVVPADLDWSDIGSWASLYDLLSKRTKNHTISRGHHIGVGDKNCLIYAQGKLLATVGLEDIIIVDTDDVTLVCHKNKSQEVKTLLEKLKKEGKVKYL